MQDIDLTQLFIPCAEGPDDPQIDYSIRKRNVDVEVVFRDHQRRLLELIGHYPCVLGCVAWLTDMRVLNALASCQKVSILVQKEDFLRPDLDSASDFALTLRRAYDRLQTVSRIEAPGIASDLSTLSDDSAGPIRCVGNYNADKHPAWPRMHNKFLVFCSEKPRLEWSEGHFVLHPQCVWTGSYNFTFNANKSFENSIIIRNVDVANAYANEWAQILAFSEPLDWESRWCAPQYRIGT